MAVRTRLQPFRGAIAPTVVRVVVTAITLSAAGVVAPGGSTSASGVPHAAGSVRARAHIMKPPVYHRVRQDGCPSAGCPPLNAHLTYGGGPVVHNLTVYTIFWQAPGYHFEAPYGGLGTSVADFRYEDLIDRFFADAGGTAYYNTLTQYSDQSGPVQNTLTFGGSVTDLGKLNQFNASDLGTAAQPLQDSDIQDVITQAATDRSWPLGSPNVEYFVFTPATVHSCYSSTSCDAEIDSGSGAYCAYHSDFAAASGTVLYANMFDAGYSTACGGPNWMYKGMPVGPLDGNGPNGDPVADYEISPASHEMAEAVTDPTPTNGWFDATNSNEVADTCAYNFTPLNPDKGDVVLGSHSYLIQTEWSNATKSCAMSYTRPVVLLVNSKADSVPALGLTPLCSNAPGGDSSNPHFSLRCAIEDANNDALAGATDHVITFKKCAAPCAIKLGSPLPAVQAFGLNIAAGGRATLLGRHAVPRGLVVDAGNVTISGLTVQDFRFDAIDVVKSLFVTIGGKKGDTLRDNGGYGLSVGDSTSDSSKVTITSDRIYGNAKGGINLLGLPPRKCAAGLTVGAPNDYSPCPSILTASPGKVSGTSSCDEECTVQLFLVPKRQDKSRHGQAIAYIGQARVSSGTWSITPTVTLAAGERVTATVTDPDRRETSEFSANAAVS